MSANPLPWTYDNGLCEILDDNGCPVAGVYADSDEDADANGALIVAAVNERADLVRLLERAEKLLTEAEEVLVNEGAGPELMPLVVDITESLERNARSAKVAT